MNYFRDLWLIAVFGCVMLIILTGCVRMSYYNDSGEMDAEIIIKPTEEAIENTIDSGEIQPGVSAEIQIPISQED